MKLLIHAGLFVMGTVEVDTETGKWNLLTSPLVNADMSISGEGAISADDGAKAGNVVLAALNQAQANWILKRAGIDMKVMASKPEKEPLQLTNVLGGNGKASA